MDGIPLNGVPGNYDYSRFKADLDENHLNENLGLHVASALARYGTQFFCSSDPDHSQPALSIAQAIDWNCNNSFEADVAADINTDAQMTVLKGFEDWPATVLSTAAGRAGTTPVTPVKIQQELKLSQANSITLPPIAQVNATTVAGGVKLSWNKVPLDRVLAYQVLRRSSEAQYRIVGTSQSADFVDTVPQGSYSYVVKTIYAPQGNVSPKPFADPDLGNLLSHTEAVSEVMSVAKESTAKMATLGTSRGKQRYRSGRR